MEATYKAALAYASGGPAMETDNNTKLKLYALFKQASSGDVSGKKPNSFNMAARYKYNAWTKLRGMSKEDAMKGYVAEMDKLAPTWRSWKPATADAPTESTPTQAAASASGDDAASLEKRFQAAQEYIAKGPSSTKPSREQQLQFYALFKQASKGDVQGKKPSSFNAVARFKYNAWAKLKGTSKEDAMKQYIDALKGIAPNWEQWRSPAVASVAAAGSAAVAVAEEKQGGVVSLPAAGASKPLNGRVAIITGASRGIGREIALTLARAGCNVTVAAKSITDTPSLPGTIFSVVKEIEALGSHGLAVQVDVRNDADVQRMVRDTVAKFGRVDIMINNAGALWWRSVEKTPMKRYDLINQVNARASFMCAQACLPHMKKQGGGHIIMMSPPIDLRMLPNKVAYCISKFGMTMVALGLAQEVKKNNIMVNALWPATMVESYATKNFNMSDRSQWRKASILADCVLMMVTSRTPVTGKALIEEDYMRSQGVVDFRKYRCDPNVEPTRFDGQEFPELGRVGDPSNTTIRADSGASTASRPGASSGVTTSKRGRILTVTLDRANKYNAITTAMYDGVRDALRKASKDDSTSVVVVTGAGSFFSSGNCVADFAKLLATGEGDAFLAHFRGFIEALSSFPKPIIAAVNGPAVGVGVTMLAHFDLVFASDTAFFEAPFTRLGIAPEAASTYLFPKLMSRHYASSLLLESRRLSAKQAEAAGLVGEVVSAGDLRSVVAARAAAIASMPLSGLVLAKRLLLDNAYRSGTRAALMSEVEAMPAGFDSKEFAKFVRAFAAKHRLNSTGVRASRL